MKRKGIILLTVVLIARMGPEEAAKFVAADQKKWEEVAKAANIVPK